MAKMRATTGLVLGLALVALVGLAILMVQSPGPASPAAPLTQAEVATRVLPESAGRASARIDGPAADSNAPKPVSLAGATPPPATVLGRVVNSRGLPLEGVSIGLSGASESREGPAILTELVHPAGSAISGPDGGFRITQRTDGHLIVVLTPHTGRPQLAGEIAVLPGITLDLGDVPLADPRMILGGVQDESGHPVAGAEVLASDGPGFVAAFLAQSGSLMTGAVHDGVIPDEDWIRSFVSSLPQCARTMSAADGSFHLDLVLPDNEQLFVAARAPGYAIATWIDAEALLADGRPFVPLTLRSAPARIAGRVACADGSSPRDETLVVARSDSPVDRPNCGRVVRAGPDGAFSITGLTDEPHDVFAITRTRAPSATVKLAAGTTDAIIVLGSNASVTVHVERDGVPADHFELDVMQEEGALLPHAPDWEMRTAGPGSQGLLRLTDLHNGRIGLQAFAEGLCSTPSELYPFADGPAHELTLTLAAARSVAGSVVDAESGEPISGAELRGSFAHSRDVTSPDGRFEIGPLPSGEVSLGVRAAGYASVVQTVPANLAAPLLVKLERRTLVQVRVGPVLREALRALQANPGSNEIVHVVPIDGTKTWSRKLTPTGVFLDDLKPGRYRLALGTNENTLSPEFAAIPGQLVTLSY